MPESLRPFRSDRYQMGQARDGQPLMLAPMSAAAADVLGAGAAVIDPWAHYGFDAARMTSLLEASREGVANYQVECGSALQMLFVTPACQRRGIGTAILTWLESEAHGHFRNLWLCVSAFNTDAQRFYRAHGFERVATLEGLMRAGDDELLMRKLIV